MRMFPRSISTVATLSAVLCLTAAGNAHSEEPPNVTEVAWLLGTWETERNGSLVRETWLPPVGGVMPGVGQTSAPGKPTVVEFMKITAEPAGLTFTAVLEHQANTAFVRISGGPTKVVFENKAHDFPQRVIYERCGSDLCARIEGTVDGKLRGQDWRYHRVASTLVHND